MVKIGAYIIRPLSIPVLPFTLLIEALIKNIFVIASWNAFLEGAILEFVFLKEQFWNAFFEGTITLGNWLKWLLIHDSWLM